MTLITGSITGRWRSKDYPGHIVRMYGSGLKEFAKLRPYGGNLRENLLQTHALTRWDLSGQRLVSMDFAEIEQRVLGYFSGHDPRNHIGKFAYRRYIK